MHSLGRLGFLPCNIQTAVMMAETTCFVFLPVCVSQEECSALRASSAARSSDAALALATEQPGGQSPSFPSLDRLSMAAFLNRCFRRMKSRRMRLPRLLSCPGLLSTADFCLLFGLCFFLKAYSNHHLVTSLRISSRAGVNSRPPWKEDHLFSLGRRESDGGLTGCVTLCLPSTEPLTHAQPIHQCFPFPGVAVPLGLL